MARPPVKNKRKNIIRVRLTDDEYKEIQEMIGDKPISTFIREVLFEKRKFYIPSGEYIKAINSLIVEQKRLGNNLNQLTKEAHVQKLTSPYQFMKFDEFIKGISELYTLESEIKDIFLDIIRKAKAV